MASLKDIRRRISSVKNTQQITKAMKLVAASKLRRAQQAIGSARPFAEKLEELCGRVLSEISESLPIQDSEKRNEVLANLHPLLKSDAGTEAEEGKSKRIALLIVSSDRGLCGAYNTNILKGSLKEYKLFKDAGFEVDLYFVGRRGYEFFLRKGISGEFFSDTWAGKFTTSKSDKIADLLTQRFLSGEIAGVHICYTQFKSVLTQVVSKKKLLPLEISVSEKKEAAEASLTAFIYEPERKNILANLLPSLVKTSTYRMLADSLASEYGARMTAMDSATRNAGTMISRLSLEANRVRQASITKELMEIVGGAEALKG